MIVAFGVPHFIYKFYFYFTILQCILNSRRQPTADILQDLSTRILTTAKVESCSGNGFFTNVKTECFVDANENQYIKIHANSVYDNNVQRIQNDKLVITLLRYPIPTPNVLLIDDAKLNQNNQLVGVALDGIPIYSSIYSNNDVFSSFKIDGCGGTYGDTPDGVRYHYRVMPSCILDLDNKKQRRNLLIESAEELLDHFVNYFGSYILGYTIYGYPIYSPYNSRGHLYDDLDSCNGKFVNGSYGYYGTINYPYLVGCKAPGNYQSKNIDVDEEDITTTIGVSYLSCPQGYYSLKSWTGCKPCPAGTFTTSRLPTALGSCGQPCPLGHYCPEACIKPIKCPGGRYGASMRLKSSDCSGSCQEGYFCPLGSIRRDSHPCGNASYYCPPGSATRQRVENSFYSIPKEASPAHRSGQVACPVAHYCMNGIKAICPPGTYGETTNLDSPTCSGVCPQGFYCPNGTVTPIPCPPGHYGDKSGLSHSNCSGRCEAGYWCPPSSVSPRERICPAGRVADGIGLSTEQCTSHCEVGSANEQLSSLWLLRNITTSSLALIKSENSVFCQPSYCPSGYYCPAGTVKGSEFRCGSPSVYCPLGSVEPIPVDVGYYSVGLLSSPLAMQNTDDESMRTNQMVCEPGHWCAGGIKYQCPAGYYGDRTGLTTSTCSGLCEPGFYCPQASVSSTAFPCGSPASYCPRGSSNPLPVPLGYYSYGNTLSTASNISICIRGSHCTEGISRLCPAGRYSLSNGQSDAICSGLCSAGYYCLEGSISATQHPCPGGRYGGLGMTDDNCAGPCLQGYYCPTSSTMPTQFECGYDTVYCPAGSATPVAVTVGHYSVGGTETTRSGQAECISSKYTGTPPAGSERHNICPSTTVLY